MLPRAVLLLHFLQYVSSTQIILGYSKYDGDSQTFSNALEKCNNDGKNILPTEQDERNLIRIKKALQRYGLQKAWFGLRREETEEWLYTDGRKHDQLRRSDNSDLDCGALRKSGPYATKCSKKVSGYICERKGCDGCTSGHCVGVVCLSIHCEELNWFDASSRCFKNNMTLSVQPDDSLNKLVTKESCTEMWIGLARAWWRFILPGENKSEIASSYRWSKYNGEPCAVVSITGEDVTWESVSCDEMQPVLCFDYSFEKSSTEPSDELLIQMTGREAEALPTHETSKDAPSSLTKAAFGPRQLIIFILVGIIGSIIMIVSMACFLTSCLGKRRSYKVSQETACTGNGRAIEVLDPTAVNAVHHQDSDPEAIQFYAMCARDSTQDMTSSSEDGDVMPPDMHGGQYMEPYQGTGVLVLTGSQESFSRPDPCYYGNSDYLRPLQASPIVTDV